MSVLIVWRFLCLLIIDLSDLKLVSGHAQVDNFGIVTLASHLELIKLVMECIDMLENLN